MRVRSATKVLSDNDVGATKSHQAGFLIPKSLIKDGLFDALSDEKLNPRIRLKFVDHKNQSTHYFNFIYYNNKLFGGTRHEYRLTGMTKWIKDNGLRSGDSIEISRDSSFEYSVFIQKTKRRAQTLSSESWILLYGEEANNGE
jgi:Restriction endonuclease EcoRII, N-terminal